MSDPYVKCWLVLGGKKIEKRKSPVYKCNLNPTFNQVHYKNIEHLFLNDSFQIFDYEVPREQLKDCALDISVKDYDMLGRNEMIGNIIIDGE